MKNLIRSVALLAAVFTASVQAASVYSVSDATDTKCGGHGLWTGNDFTTSSGYKCKNYFSIDESTSLLTVDKDAGTAKLVATAFNKKGWKAVIDIDFSVFADSVANPATGYKQEGGLPYDEANVDFFQSILGKITIKDVVYDIDAFKMFYLQFGLGANAKSKTAFGASAWVKSCQHASGVSGHPAGCMKSDHWDLNLNLTPTPIPGALVLFGMGLAGLGVIRKRAIKA